MEKKQYKPANNEKKTYQIVKINEMVGLKDKFIKQEGKEIWIRLIYVTKCVIT